MDGHDLLLGGGDAVDVKHRGHGYGARDERECDWSLVRVACRRGDDADLTPAHLDGCARCGQVAA